MWTNFKNGFIKENPVLGLYLGMCSTLALSSSIDSAFGMAMCVTIVLIASNMIISAMRKIIPDEIRIPVYIVIIASLVSIVQMFVQAYMPELYTSLGAFLSLIVVNCIILGRAEAFANKNGVIASAVDGLGMGLGYGFAILLIAITREFLATMMLTFHNPFNAEQVIFQIGFKGLADYGISFFSTSVGAFLTFGCFAALFTVLRRNGEKKKEGAK